MRHSHGKYSLRIDCESIHYITRHADAECIANIIKSCCDDIGLVTNEATIADLSAGVGGDTLVLSEMFGQVDSIEIDPERYSLLQSNIESAGVTNVSCTCADSLVALCNVHSDVIYVDPPWGGRGYRYVDNLQLTFAGIALHEFIVECFNVCAPAFVAIKLPLNYDFVILDAQLAKHGYGFELHELARMAIIIVMRDVRLGDDDKAKRMRCASQVNVPQCA